MRRREFIAGLGAAVWPLAARSQQPARVRSVGLLSGSDENDAATVAYVTAFRQALKNLGWIEGSNIRVDVRYGNLDDYRLGVQAEELVRSAPEVFVTGDALARRVVLQKTRTIPVVMAADADPVAAGVVTNIAHPEGNVTGFVTNVPTIGGKWVELLKEVVPGLGRIALIFNPDFAGPTYGGWLPPIETAAAQLGVEAIRAPVRDASEVTHAIDVFATKPHGGIVMVPPLLASADRAAVIRQTAQHQLPAIYFWRSDVVDGGLVSYGVNLPDLFRSAASYVDRILRGTKPGDLPIQFPSRFQLVLNLKTAKAIGLTIPASFLLRADEVIE